MTSDIWTLFPFKVCWWITQWIAISSAIPVSNTALKTVHFCVLHHMLWQFLLFSEKCRYLQVTVSFVIIVWIVANFSVISKTTTTPKMNKSTWAKFTDSVDSSKVIKKLLKLLAEYFNSRMILLPGSMVR